MRQRPLHLFLNTLPTLSPADTMAKIKGVTSKRLRERVSSSSTLAKSMDTFLFCFTAGNVSTETIKQYVENQKTRGENCVTNNHSQD